MISAMNTITYAGFWRRFLASIVDSILLTVAFNIVWLVFPESVKENQIFISIIALIPIWLYYSLLESSTKQGTLGKIILGIKVVDYSNQRISFARATARHFSKIISSLILMIGFIMIAFTPKKQGLHDIIAGTLVTKN